MVRLSPADHDRAVAVVSHRHTRMADALMLTAGRAGAKLLFRLAAGSFETRPGWREPIRCCGGRFLPERRGRPANLVRFFKSAARPVSRMAAGDLRRARALNDEFRKDHR